MTGRVIDESMRRAWRLMHALAVGALLVSIVAACFGGGSASSVTPPPDAEVSITASGNAFQQREVTAPAGAPFQLFFRNLDGFPHNVAIYTDGSASQALFVGDTITDAATLYEVPALDAGTWFFRCDMHPNMTGTLEAGA